MLATVLGIVVLSIVGLIVAIGVALMVSELYDITTGRRPGSGPKAH